MVLNATNVQLIISEKLVNVCGPECGNIRGPSADVHLDRKCGDAVLIRLRLLAWTWAREISCYVRYGTSNLCVKSMPCYTGSPIHGGNPRASKPQEED